MLRYEIQITTTDKVRGVTNKAVYHRKFKTAKAAEAVAAEWREDTELERVETKVVGVWR